MMKVNRNGFFINLNGSFKTFELSDFETSELNISKEQPDTKNGKYINLEIGKETYYNGYYLSGGIYSNTPVKIYTEGIGLSREVFNFWNIYVKAKGTANMVYANGLFGELYQNMEVGGDVYAGESKLYVSGMSFGVTPSLSLEYDINNNFSVYGAADYGLYSEMTDFNVTIKDRYDSGQTASLSLNDLNPSLSVNGLGLRTGVQFSF